MGYAYFHELLKKNSFKTSSLVQGLATFLCKGTNGNYFGFVGLTASDTTPHAVVA